MADTENAPRADVAICTYTMDRWGLLVRAVESALAQSVLPQQLIIAVDHNDELLQRCRQEWGDQSNSSVEIAVVANRFAGRNSSARNTALLYARSDIVVFLDDDAEAAPDWLELVLAVYATNPEAVAVGCAPLPNYEAPRPSWFPPHFDWVFGCHYRSMPDHLAPARHLIGTSLSVRRNAVLGVGGFHIDDFEDLDLSHRIAQLYGPAAVLYEPQAKVYHRVPAERMTWSYFRWRCFTANRIKVSAFAEMGGAGNIRAELRFGVSVLLTLLRALLAAVTGQPARLRQAVVAVIGLALAGCGYIAGRGDVARHDRPKNLTSGLNPTDVERAQAGIWAADDA